MESVILRFYHTDRNFVLLRLVRPSPPCAPARRASLQVPMFSVLETWSYAADNTSVGQVPQEAQSVEGWWNTLVVGEGLDEDEECSDGDDAGDPTCT